ncbi:MAG: FAD-binding oxidoreductase [Alphaproteobacteria bacterium]|nr:FAD-binding oxidoreductase [Alphaproteobacteria bacterium]
MDADPSIFERLANRLGPGGWTTDPDLLAPHLVEWRQRYRGTTPFMAMPASTEEVADIVRLCAQARLPITPQSGNTGLVGGQIPDGELLLSLKRMNRIRSIDAADDSLVAEAGCILATVQQAAADAGRLFPLSLGSQGSAMIGGLVSTNAGGVHVARYGMMRDLVLGLEVVLADGSILPGLKSLRKDNTGYDLRQLFVGAEGTLGVVTAATLKLFPKPSEHVTAMAGVMSAADALAFLHLARQHTGALSAFELMNRLSVDVCVRHMPGVRDPFAIAPSFLVLLEFESVRDDGLEAAVEDALGAAMEAGLVVDAAIAKSQAQERAFWKLREEIPAAHRLEGAQVNLDVSVPVSAVPRFLDVAGATVERVAPGARVIAFGHAGDGNIHYTIVQKPGADPAAFPGEALVQAVQDDVLRLNGSISAEHGIGVSRRHELPRYKSPVALAAMRTLKEAFDPLRIMNPRAMI